MTRFRLQHLQHQNPFYLSCKLCVKIAFTYTTMYQALMPFLPSYSDKTLISLSKFCIFAPAIEGTAYCAENRSSMKTGAGLK